MLDFKLYSFYTLVMLILNIGTREQYHSSHLVTIFRRGSKIKEILDIRFSIFRKRIRPLARDEAEGSGRSF